MFILTMEEPKVQALRAFIKHVEHQGAPLLVTKSDAMQLRRHNIILQLNRVIESACAALDPCAVANFDSGFVAREAVNLLRENGYVHARVRNAFALEPTIFTVTIPIR